MNTHLLPSFTKPAAWAQEQWNHAELGDARRTLRAVKLGAAIAAQSAASLPQQTGSWGNLKAAYRLLNEEAVTHEKLSMPHWQATRAYAELIPAPVVLFPQDTSELDFTTHWALAGAGFTGNGRGYGFALHSCLAIVPNQSTPDIIGLAYQIAWTRQHQPRRKTEKRTDRYRRHTEAAVWTETLEAIGEAPADALWVSVGDRGSDIFSYVRRAQKLNWRVLLRVQKDRIILRPDGQMDKMKRYARTLPIQSEATMIRRGRTGHVQRQITLNIAWSAVTWLSPRNDPREKKSEPIPGWIVRCWNDQENMEWILFTTVPLSDHDAREQKNWYEHRWLIEEYHKCLKTGCAIEKRQLMTAHGLLAVLGFLAITAVRLLQLRGLARTAPEQRARDAGIEPLFLKLAADRLNRKEAELTLRQFWRGVAMLGGFLGRTGDGEPGWQTLWDGWRRLQDMVCGAEWAMAQ